jgi:hypothetical protein
LPLRKRNRAMSRRYTRVAELLPPTEEQSIAQLFRRIVNGLNGLIDRQIQLAKQEAKENLFEVLGASKTLAIGAGIGVVGALFLLNLFTLALVLGLNEVSGWLGVGKWLGWVVGFLLLVALFAVTYIVVRRGLREVRVSPLSRTRQTLMEDADWAGHLLTPSGK